MGAVAAGAAIAGAGLSAYGAITSAQDQSNLDNERAQVAQEQAQEIAQREAANETLRDQQAYRGQLQFGAQFAGSGKAGTGIGSQLEIQRQATQANVISNEQSQFQDQMLNQQAGIDTTLASETMTSGYINAASSLLGGASRAASVGTSGNNSPGLGGTQSAPDLETMLNNSPQLSAPAYGGFG